MASSSEMDANQDSDFLDDMVGMVHDAFGVPRPECEGLESTSLGADFLDLVLGFRGCG